MNKTIIGKNLREFREARGMLEEMDRINTAIDIIRKILKCEDIEWDTKGQLLITVNEKMYTMEIKDDEYLLKVSAYKLIEQVLEDSGIFNAWYINNLMGKIKEP